MLLYKDRLKTFARGLMIIAIHCTKCRVKGMKADYFKTLRATFNLTVHIVLVTKYRTKVFCEGASGIFEGSFSKHS